MANLHLNPTDLKQNLNPMEADFTWLHHIPNRKEIVLFD